MVLRFDQLQKVVNELNSMLVGSQLQDIIMMESYLFLQFYRKGPVSLGLYLQSNEPSLGVIFDELKKKKTIIKPIVLFLRAHAKNKILKKIWLEEQEGRVVHLLLESMESQCEITWVMIPRALNVIAKTKEKSISLRPIKNLPAALKMEDESADFDVGAYFDKWVFRFENPKAIKSVSTDVLIKRKEKNIEKKKQAIENLESELTKANIPWGSIGNFLVSYQSMDVPGEWSQYVNRQLSLSQNIQNCFEQHKSQEKKNESLKEKILHLKKEVEVLLSEDEVYSAKAGERPLKASIGSLFLQKAEAKGRKLSLNNNIEAVVGKSGKDNLALLRKAQAWDLWLHLKDFPGAHAIIRRPRNFNVDYLDLLKVGEWVLRESKLTASIESGDKYDIIVVECRYVKPIKGDKLGRVSYQNEKIFTLKIP
jgi:predicted ribosome quality control (RQC) complex YloA/Tae2 family protein